MLIGGWAVGSLLVVVLFLTMIIFDLTVMNFSYFLMLFYFIWKFRS